MPPLLISLRFEPAHSPGQVPLAVTLSSLQAAVVQALVLGLVLLALIGFALASPLAPGWWPPLCSTALPG